MFRSWTGEGHLYDGPSSSSPGGNAVASARLVSQESSWIGLLSAVSKPALSFLQKYLPGRSRHPSPADPVASWLHGESQRSFVDEDTEFLTHLRGERGGAAEPWLTADALREMGIESGDEAEVRFQQVQDGFVSSPRTFLGQVLLSSGSQEVRPWVTVRGSESGTWWGSLWGGEGNTQREMMSQLSQAEDGRLCPQRPHIETKDRSSVFVQSSGGENTGGCDHKELPHNNGPHRVQNSDGSTAEQRLCIRSSASNTLLTPELDNGYSSLEEEHALMSRLVTAPSEGPQEAEPPEDVKEESCEGGASSSANADSEEEEEQVMAVSAPQCQNKAIAFIMGCPCSDDDDGSQSDDSDSSDDDDDGFDSEGSSDLSDSSSSSSSDDDDDDEAADSDSEADRLWNSLCKSLDPYNPQNFTAVLHSRPTPPRTIPAATPPSSTQSSPASSPPPSQDSWDDSTSASETDEAESLRLWTSFSSSDPYSPLHFQAPLRTRGSVRAKRASQTPSPQHRKEEEAAERLDSGFSDLPHCSTNPGGATSKKVRFCDNVEEFFVSCGEEEEDRRGPWEELARDRCRFLRRCQEVEQSIAYCLQPQHRRLVFRRVHDQ